MTETRCCHGCDYPLGEGHEEGCPQAPAYRQRAAELDAAELIWVCEEGHADDHHVSIPLCEERCSRCGGRTYGVKLDGLARRAVALGELLSAIKVWRNATESRLRLLNGREALDTMIPADRALIEVAQRIEASSSTQQDQPEVAIEQGAGCE